MRAVAGVTILSDLASAIGARAEESAIIAELKAGSEEAYVWLIGEFHQPIYSLVYRMVADPADAADLTQDALIRFIRAIGSYRGETKLSTWLYRLVVNLGIDRLRRRGAPVRAADRAHLGSIGAWSGTGFRRRAALAKRCSA